MTSKHLEEYRDSRIIRVISHRIGKTSQKPIRLMEVCGTHTVSIFRNGIRSVLPETVSLISGPGCPVCVTAQQDIDAFIELAGRDDVIIATYGDLMRVPGSGSSSLQQVKSAQGNIRLVYSAFDALEIARQHPERKIVFLGVGFETTAPSAAACVLAAEQQKLNNFFVFSAHKQVPPALFALMSMPGTEIDGFILPGHVSVMIGVHAYQPFFDRYQVPCVIAGFEPVDILQAVSMLVDQIETRSPKLENAYRRAVADQGNPKAMDILRQVFEPEDALWRGLGVIAQSGLKIREEFSRFDARKAFDMPIGSSDVPSGCRCGDILCGKKNPPQCPLYKNVCTPLTPVGPCMVSSEGVCSAYFRYAWKDSDEDR